MKTKISTRAALLVSVPLVVGSFGLGALAQGLWRMSVGGHSVATNVRKIGGTTYVPVADVARAFNMKVSVQGNTISFAPAGGAQQVGKVEGNIGEDLSSGLYGFKVVSVQRATTYERKYPNKYLPAAKFEAPAGQEFVIVNCRLKNQKPVRDEFALTSNVEYGGGNTALTDMDAQSYLPQEFDTLADESAPIGRYVLPGASHNFALIFPVPQGTKVKDVVFSVVRYSERTDKKSVDFRVSLQGQ